MSSDKVSVAVILAGEASLVELASLDRALLRTLILVSEHVCLQVLVHLATVWVRASVPDLALFFVLGLTAAVAGGHARGHRPA